MHSSMMRTARLLPYLAACTAPGGVPAQGGVPAGWGCTCQGGVPAQGGVPTQGGVPAQGYLPGGVPAKGVYLPRYSPPHEQNS